MLTDSTEKFLSKIVAVGACFTTIFLLIGPVTDPVNVTKFLSLGIASTMAIGVILNSNIKEIIRQHRLIWIFSGLFLVFSLSSLLLSDSPISQGLYGTYGRNNGFLTYFFLCAIMLSVISLSKKESFKRIVFWLLISGVINLAYCLWVVAFGDFVGWNNEYGNILGTFGNPNFIGSFLGIFLASLLGCTIKNVYSKTFQYAGWALVPVTIFLIFESKAIQGRVVGLFGAAMVVFLLIRSKFKTINTYLYTSFVSSLAIFSLLGALQIGPLTSLIYKTSVSLRGQYWFAGMQTGINHPFTGVGMDAFGDWYRRSRGERALELPGANTVVNAAHNVPLDMFAFGGWPLFLSYISIMSYAGICLVRTIQRTKEFDPIFAALSTAWIGYQLQSIISINQIGLALWGWLLTGTLISYDRITRFEQDTGRVHSPQSNQQKISRTSTKNQEKNILITGMFGLIGLLLALPPLSADSKWRAAQLNQSVKSIEESMQPSYFNPHNSMKFLVNIQTLEQSGFSKLAYSYAKIAIQWNQNNFDFWRILYFLQESKEIDKELALINMRRLDPLNSDVTNLK